MTLCFSCGPRLLPGLPRLCRTSPLRTSLLSPTPVLSPRSNPWTLSLSTSPAHCGWAWECEPLLGWEALFDKNLCCEFSALLLEPQLLHLPMCSPLRCGKLPQPCLWGGFPVCGNISSFVALSPGCIPREVHPHPKTPCLPLFFIFCPTSFWGDWLALLEVCGPLLVFRRCSVAVVPHADEFLMGLQGYGMISPSYPSAILKVSLQTFLI